MSAEADKPAFVSDKAFFVSTIEGINKQSVKALQQVPQALQKHARNVDTEKFSIFPCFEAGLMSVLSSPFARSIRDWSFAEKLGGPPTSPIGTLRTILENAGIPSELGLSYFIRLRRGGHYAGLKKEIKSFSADEQARIVLENFVESATAVVSARLMQLLGVNLGPANGTLREYWDGKVDPEIYWRSKLIGRPSTSDAQRIVQPGLLVYTTFLERALPYLGVGSEGLGK